MEIKNVKYSSTEPIGDESKEPRRVWSSVVVIVLSLTVALTSCGGVCNRAETIPKPKPVVQAVSYAKYTVQPGDTLSGIAAKHSGRWPDDTPLAVIAESIRERNIRLLPNGYVLQAGTVLEVPVWK